METAPGRWSFWAPRILGILFTLFTGLFALDVFGEYRRPVELVTALAMHLIPTALVAVALVIAWRWEWVGGVLFLALAGLYAMTIGRGHPTWILAIAGPAAIVGVLFVACGWLRGSARQSRSKA